MSRLCLTLGLLLLVAPVRADSPLELVRQRCFGCHGPDKQRGGLRLDARPAFRAAGDEALRRVESNDDSERMPPTGERLTAAEVAALRAWLRSGLAGLPETPAGADPNASHWAWRPVKAVEPPTLPGVSHPIDRFMRAELARRGLSPAPPADRYALIRRLSFDLTGLPPTADEADAFARDPDPRAYERLVDRLLASPRYGERWARHWLDIVHYGDTHGYDKDQPRHSAYTYRDYVIRSLNADKPYARFLREQIAGDYLYPDTRDGVEATGFLAAGPWDLIGHIELPESKTDGKIARHLDRDDFVATTMGTFASVTAQCAQCHDHKFDPVSQREYYGLQAVFAAIDRTEREFDTDPAIARRRAELTALAARAAPRRGAHPQYGYHSAIEPSADRAKWVQLDLGRSVTVSSVTLSPCWDDFAGIGDGFGFPVRYKVESSDDPEFLGKRTLFADRTGADVPRPGIVPVTHVGTAVGRYVRVTATKLAPRSGDWIFALAEVRVEAAGGDLASRWARLSALDSIEAAPRWGLANLTDGLAPVPADYRPDPQADAAARELATLPPQGRAFVGGVHRGAGNFVGTGADGGRARPIFLLSRGQVTKPGEAVAPGAPARLGPGGGPFDLPPDAPEGARRAALADWLARPDHPLTWRSAVNRAWHYHFGRGMVDPPGDFGRMGGTPSHPELLDWLAAHFRDDGGSLKRLHRLIVTSETYRQAVTANPAAEAADPDNRLLWRQNLRKLEAEAVRDSILFAAGTLDLTMYGPGWRDFVVERPEHSPHYRYDLADPDDPATRRRAVYRFVVRSQTQPWATALDCADPSQRVDRRNESVTAPQALALLNGGFVLAQAKHLARRANGSPEAAFRLALGRSPSPAERAAIDAYAKAHGLPALGRVLFNLNEFAFAE